MSDYTARVSYSRAGTPVRIIEITARSETVDILVPNGECEDWRDAAPVLDDAGWRIVQAPYPAGTQVFPVERKRR